jgi:hypothetical protein
MRLSERRRLGADFFNLFRLLQLRLLRLGLLQDEDVGVGVSPQR